MCKYRIFLIFLFIKNFNFPQECFQNFKDFCCDDCLYYFGCKNISFYIINIPQHEYKKENRERKELCQICYNGTTNIEFICNTNVKHFCCINCFFDSFLNQNAFTLFNNEKILCPLCPQEKENYISINDLKEIFLKNTIFNTETNGKLNTIKQKLNKREGSNIDEKIQEDSLEDLKKEYQILNVNCQNGNTIKELRKRNPKKDEIFFYNIILYKPCPCCNTTIYKEFGSCNAIRCANCECRFCWLCGWFSFNQTGGGHDHHNFYDCINKRENLLYANEYLATYYGYNYLFNKQEYKKPRFFKVVENEEYWGTEECKNYLKYKNKINEKNYEIETSMKNYNSTFKSAWLVPDEKDTTIYKWDGRYKRQIYKKKIKIKIKQNYSFLKSYFLLQKNNLTTKNVSDRKFENYIA